MNNQDFNLLIEQRLADMEARISQLTDRQLADKARQVLILANVDLESAAAKARVILETIILNLFRAQFPDRVGKRWQLINMIEELTGAKVFSKKILGEIHYLRNLGNLGAHAADESVELTDADVQLAIIHLHNLVDWYIKSHHRPADAEAMIDSGPPPPNPYKGLAAFTEADARDFFGRVLESNDLASLVAARPLVAVVGASGSGKSSLIQAGLLPRLRKKVGDTAADWLVASFRPQGRPFYELAKSLARLTTSKPIEQAAETQDLIVKLEAGKIILSTLADLLPERNERQVLLVIDQFEELFTLGSDHTQQERFLQVLLADLDQPGPLTLLLVLRADFMGHALAFPALQEALNRYPPRLVGPIADPRLLRAVIEEPARQQKVSFEPLLVERILRDLGQHAEAGDEHHAVSLPLLEFTLTQLWERQTERTLTHLAYEKLGGVRKALSSHADQALNQFSAADRLRLRRVMVQLVRPGEGTEDTRQVATKTQVGEENWDLVTRLADLRLVVTGRDAQERETVEVVHEALIRTWQPLRDWMNQARAFRVWQNGLRHGLAEWESGGRDEGALLRGARLVEAEERLAEHAAELTEEELGFIQESVALREREAAERERQRDERERLHRFINWGLAAFLVVALALAGIAGWQAFEARKQAQEAILQSNVATEQRALADRNFAAAMTGVDGLINDLAKNLRSIRGVTQETTRALLSTADAVMNKLVASSGGNTELMLRQIQLYEQFEQTFWFVGDRSQALASLDRAIQVYQELAHRERDVQLLSQAQALYYEVIQQKATVVREMGDLDQAVVYFRQALAVADEMIKGVYSDKKEAWLNFAKVLGRIGDTFRTAGRFVEAQKEYEAAKDIIFQWLAKNNPDDLDWNLELSWHYNRLGDNLLQLANHEGFVTLGTDGKARLTGDPKLAAAVDVYAKALNIRRHLATQNSLNTHHLRDLIWSLCLNGMAQLAIDLSQAGLLLDEALSLADSGLNEDPSNTELTRYKALALAWRSDRFLLEHRQPEAIADYRAALALRETLAQRDPSNARWQRDLFYTLKRTFRVCQNARLFEDVRAYHLRALQVGAEVETRYKNDAILSSTLVELRSSTFNEDP